MATWQFDIFLIPRASVTMDTGHLRLTGLELDREFLINLATVDIPRESLLELIEGMPDIKSWDKESKIWGDMEGDRVDVLMASDKIKEIFVRIDVRIISLIFLSKIIKIARTNSLVLLTSADQILEPSVKLLMNAIKRSGAFRFVLDPQDFLRKLNQSSSGDD